MESSTITQSVIKANLNSSVTKVTTFKGGEIIQVYFDRNTQTVVKK
jgi:hypothetical protein